MKEPYKKIVTFPLSLNTFLSLNFLWGMRKPINVANYQRFARYHNKTEKRRRSYVFELALSTGFQIRPTMGLGLSVARSLNVYI